MDPFDGYPYLVTRIGHTALRHATYRAVTRSNPARRWSQGAGRRGGIHLTRYPLEQIL